LHEQTGTRQDNIAAKTVNPMSAEKDKTRRVKPRVVNSMQAMKGKTRSVNKETGAVNPMLGEKGKYKPDKNFHLKS
jgi:hypothetical protein